MRTEQLFISLILGLGLTLGLLWLLGGGAPSAHADSPHYVAPGAICGAVTPCHTTIQEAVDAAAPGDEILVATGTYTGMNNYGGLAQVVYISKTVTIRGGYTTTNWTTPYPITQLTTLDAQGQGRVLYITGDISPTIEGLRITGGDAAGLGGDPFDMGSAGGGVYIITATATLSNNQMFSSTANFGGGLFLYFSPAVLSGNTIMSNATTVSGGGGGLFLYRSSAVLSENTVISNTAYQGGGLYLNNSAAILSENTIMSNTAAVGGGLSVDGSDATLSGDTIASNTATGNGGGLRLFASNIALINAIIADNQASLRGSGLFINASSPHLLHTTIAHNSGGDGSGVHVTAGGGAIAPSP